MCNALRLYFRRENEVRRYKTIHRFLHIKTYVCEHKISSRRASDERPYGIVQTVAMLRSGIICFFDITNCLHELGTAARRAGVQ